CRKDTPATPAQSEMSFLLLTLGIEQDFFDERAQKLFAIAIGRRCCIPDPIDVFAERKDGSALLGAHLTRRGGVSLREISLRRLQFAQTSSHSASSPRATNRFSGSTAR